MSARPWLALTLLLLFGCAPPNDPTSPSATATIPEAQDTETDVSLTRACGEGHGPSCARIGARHVEHEEYARASELLAKGCERNDGSSCHSLAELVARGLGEAPDVVRAAALYGRACKLGEQDGCVAHGRALMFGRGVERVPAAALARFEHSCRRGAAAGCVAAGRAIEHGNGTKADPARAYDSYRRGAKIYQQECDGGSTAACSALGGLMREGSGLPRDESAGLTLQRLACIDDDADACIAFMSRGANLVVEGKQLRIIERLGQACARGHGMACFMIGRMGPLALRMAKQHLPAGDAFERGCRLGVAAACNALGLRNFPPSGSDRGALERACALGDAPGCHHLAETLSLPGTGQDSARAASLYGRACHWRYGPACARWGTLLSRGEGVEVDAEKAALVYRLGCDFGSATACYEIGVMRQEGVRVSGDPALGARYLQQGCKQGAQQACARIGLRQISGKGGAPDKAAGSARLSAACGAGHAGACVNMADILRGGRELPRDEPSAARFYDAAARPAVPACEAAISFCRDGAPARGVKMRWGRWGGRPARLVVSYPACGDRLERVCVDAADAYTGRCALDGERCFAAGRLVRKLEKAGLGPGATQADELSKRAVAQAKKRCKQGAAAACDRLARAFEEGEGTKPNPSQTKRYRQRACRLDKSHCQK